MKKTNTNNNTPQKLSTSSLTLVKGGGDLTKLAVVTDGVEWTRTGYGEDPIKGMRDCD